MVHLEGVRRSGSWFYINEFITGIVLTKLLQLLGMG
jgi:hypothetical protein